MSFEQNLHLLLSRTFNLSLFPPKSLKKARIRNELRTHNVSKTIRAHVAYLGNIWLLTGTVGRRSDNPGGGDDIHFVDGAVDAG